MSLLHVSVECVFFPPQDNPLAGPSTFPGLVFIIVLPSLSLSPSHWTFIHFLSSNSASPQRAPDFLGVIVSVSCGKSPFIIISPVRKYKVKIHTNKKLKSPESNIPSSRRLNLLTQKKRKEKKRTENLRGSIRKTCGLSDFCCSLFSSV